MRKVTLFIVCLVSSLLIALSGGLTGYFLSNTVSSEYLIEYREQKRLALFQITSSIRNQSLSSNFRYIRNLLEKLKADRLFSSYRIINSEGSTLEQSLHFEEQQKTHIKIDVPIHFLENGEIWGTYVFLIDPSPVTDLKKKIYSATTGIVVLGIISTVFILVLINFLYFYFSKELLKYLKARFSNSNTPVPHILLSTFSPIIDISNEIIDEALENRQTAEKLREQEALFRISKQVAHDIRAPISALNTAVALLKTKPDVAINLIQSATNRVQGVADSLLDQSRPKQLTNLYSAIKDIAEEKRLLHKDLSIQIDSQIDDLDILGDMPSIHRLLSNVLDNGVEATNSKGTISISLLKTDEFAIIKIKDNGHGIPNDILKILNSNPQSFGKEKGNGLGLSFVKSYMNSVNGYYQISSDGETGSTVALHFRLAQTVTKNDKTV